MARVRSLVRLEQVLWLLLLVTVVLRGEGLRMRCIRASLDRPLSVGLRGGRLLRAVGANDLLAVQVVSEAPVLALLL